MSEQRIFDAIKSYKEEYLKATRRYTYSSENLADKANSTSLSINEIHRASDFIREGIEIINEYFLTCESIIFSLDSFARPLLETPLSVKAVGDVVALLTEIIENMNNSSRSFSISYNNENLGEVGRLTPSAGIVAKSTQLFWEQQYKTMPGYAEEEARRKNEAERNLQKKQEDTDNILETEKSIRKKIKTLKQKYYPIEKERVKLRNRCNQALTDFEKSAESYLSSFIQALPDINKEESEKLKEQVNKYRKEIKNTPKKDRKELYEEIEFLKSESEVVLSHDYLEVQKIRCKERIKPYIQEYSETLNNYLNKCYVSKTMTETFNIASEVANADDMVLPGMQAPILTGIRLKNWATVDDLKQLFPELTTVNICSELTKLKRQNLIKQIEVEGVVYYGDATSAFEYIYTVFEENPKMLKSKIPEPKPIKFKNADYTDFSKMIELVETYTSNRQKKKKHRIVFTAAILLAVLIVILTLVVR